MQIWFDDLTSKKQEAILKAFGISDPKEANWDVFPVTEIEEMAKDWRDEADEIRKEIAE